MPKQIIGDVFEKLGETVRKTGQEVTKIPGEMAKDAVQQTGIRPPAENQAESAAKIGEMKKTDEEKKRREIAFTRKQLAEFQKPSPPAMPHVEQERQKEQVEMMEIQEKKEKELPPPVLAARRNKQARVEIKGRASG
ncbi:MAG: hypothetical protein Q8P89_01520 [bacterium]|nr:hypothetical protein [bacterium]